MENQIRQIIKYVNWNLNQSDKVYIDLNESDYNDKIIKVLSKYFKTINYKVFRIESNSVLILR